MSDDNQQGRIPEYFYDLTKHSQPNFGDLIRWWMRFPDGSIGPIIDSCYWYELHDFQRMVYAGCNETTEEKINQAIVLWDQWYSDFIDLLCSIDKAKLLPAGAKSWNKHNNYINTRVDLFGRSGNVILIREMTTRRFPQCHWKKRKLRYYLIDIDAKTCTAVPSPVRYIKNHPGMEDVVYYVAKNAAKRLQKTLKALSA